MCWGSFPWTDVITSSHTMPDTQQTKAKLQGASPHGHATFHIPPQNLALLNPLRTFAYIKAPLFVGQTLVFSAWDPCFPLMKPATVVDLPGLESGTW